MFLKWLALAIALTTLMDWATPFAKPKAEKRCQESFLEPFEAIPATSSAPEIIPDTIPPLGPRDSPAHGIADTGQPTDGIVAKRHGGIGIGRPVRRFKAS